MRYHEGMRLADKRQPAERRSDGALSNPQSARRGESVQMRP
ncbi:hypothetical protein [Paenibacillus albicereus]|nr:hypothetical protein [Paenibacillus albicereus]